MAKINFGPVVNDARGKTAGIVYSKNKSGSYVRTKVTPSNPRTSYQVAARGFLTTFAQGWSAVLTAAERAAWATFATTYPTTNIFGNALTLNGLNMYVRINTVLSQIGATPLTTPPSSPSTVPIPVDPTSFSVDATGPVYSFDQTAAAPTSGTVFYFFATGGLPPGRNPTPSDYRFIGSIGSQSSPYPATVNPESIWTTRFGSIISGLNYGLLVSTVDPTVGIPTIGVPMTAIAT
jgi:hypothetical protein